MKKFFILAAAVLLTAAFAIPARADEAPAKADGGSSGGGEGGGSKSKHSDDISGGRFAGDPIYVHIPPMVLPVINNDGVEQLVTILIDVQVKDFDTADDMHTNMPKVMDALMQALYGGLGSGNLRNGKLVNVGKVRAKATEALDGVIGDGIQEVLIEGVSQRML